MLGASPGITSAAVVFQRHDILGAELQAVLVADASCVNPQRAAEIAAKAELAPHERPRRYHVVAEMSLTASAKTDLVARSRLISA